MTTECPRCGEVPARAPVWPYCSTACKKAATTKCWACEQGHYKSPYTDSHGFALPGLGMVDTTCPVTKEEVDKMEAAAREVIDG